MSLTQREIELLADYRVERAAMHSRFEFLNRMIALLEQQQAPGTVDRNRPSPEPDQTQTSLLEVGEEDVPITTIRLAIKRVMREAGKPLDAPTVAHAVLDMGLSFATEYSQVKSVVDVNLKRMQNRGEVTRTEAGWALPARKAVAA